MHKVKFSKEQKLLHHLILHSNDIPDIGLFDGQMGIALVVVRYARLRQLPVVETVGDYLVEKIQGNLTKTAPLDFSNGLSGVGWGIEYLIQNGYMEGCGTDICEEIDRKLMERNVGRISDFSLNSGLEGLLHYVIAHVQGANVCGVEAFDKDYLYDMKMTLALCRKRMKISPEFGNLINQFEEVIQGATKCYSFELTSFIKKGKVSLCQNLGLQTGLAGYLELQLAGGII